jgi:hypothetical protein
MFLLDLVGAVLTVITLLFLGLSGYLLAKAALRERAAEDPLALAIAALLAASAEAVGIGLFLGAVGLLRIEIGLALLAAITLALLRREKSLGGDPWGLARTLGRRTWATLRAHPALALIAFHAAGTEALRGLLRPPLSWDSLMYHLQTAATWLQDHRISPVFGANPMSFYGYQPANGAVWLWWWMAPSHSEIYANLTFFPQTILLALACGGVARELGARRHWPLAGFLIFLTPTVIRFAATQYVDIFLGAALAAGTFFTLRWMREARGGEVLLAGAGLGLAAGTKVLGLPYALALAGMAVALALVFVRGDWRRRLPQLAAALLAFALLGGYFYVRNVADGVGPFAARCEGTPGAEAGPDVPSMPRPNTVLALIGPMLRTGMLLDAFLGVLRPGSIELGVGPQTILLLPALLLLPLIFLRAGPGHGPDRDKFARLGAVVVWSQIAVQLLLWVAVPYASSGHVFANIRYLIGALGLAFAAVVVMAERKVRSEAHGAWIEGLAIALAVQGLLMLHTEMPRDVRLAVALADAGAAALVFSPRLRAFLRRRWAPIAVAGLGICILIAPLLASFRVEDRRRAFFQEYTAHKTSAHTFANAWGWLDRNGGSGTVAVQSTPINFFVYPAMGAHLERRAIYANINRQDYRQAVLYPACNPRVDPDPQAWLENLLKQDVRWLYVSRFSQTEFPPEYFWARQRPDLFAPRYADDLNVIFEVLPVAARDQEGGR